MYIRSSNQVMFPFFWKIKCDIWKLFETDSQQLDPSLAGKKKEHIITSQRRLHSAMRRSKIS